jgi:hypothetical protein
MKTSRPKYTCDEILNVRSNLLYNIHKIQDTNIFCCLSEEKIPIIKVDKKTLSFPLTKENLEKIKDSCEDTPFGRGEQTIYDPNIRKGYQIEPEKIELFGPLQKKMYSDSNKILEEIKKSIAPGYNTLFFELYKLLIYGEGDHFKLHVDTLRSKNHIGTLVM